METDAGQAQQDAQPVLFRSVKRRKVYRQRATSPVAETAANPLLSPVSDVTTFSSGTTVQEHARTEEEGEESGRSMAEILRLRKLRKQRVGGVEFRAASHSATPVLQVMERAKNDEAESEGGLNVAKRFVGQTGLSAEVADKHM